MPALQNFLRDELPRRGWSMKDFASHARLSLSNAYLIVRDGEDNVRSDTFENIATALGMTPAELYVAIGKGRLDDDPERVPVLAAVRQIAKEHLDAVDRIVRAFVVVPPTVGKRNHARRFEAPRPNPKASSKQDESGPDSSLTDWYPRKQPALSLAVPAL